jgi:hypothetical protein
MNHECKNPECPNGNRIIMMCRVGTDFCSQACELHVGSQPDPKPPVRKRSRKKAGAK